MIEEIEDWKHLSFNEDGKPGPALHGDDNGDRRASLGDPDAEGEEDGQYHSHMDVDD